MYRELRVLTTWSCIASMFAPTLATAQVAVPEIGQAIEEQGVVYDPGRYCYSEEYVVHFPTTIDISGGNGGVLDYFPLVANTLLKPEVLWDCAPIDEHIMFVLNHIGPVFHVFLLDDDDTASLQEYCAAHTCNDSTLDDLGIAHGVFVSDDTTVYEGYDDIYLHNADPTLTGSWCNLHQGVFRSPAGEEYRVIARIHTLEFTSSDESIEMTEFAPTYVVLEFDSDAEIAASNELAYDHDELVKSFPPKKHFGVKPRTRESIYPPVDKLSDAAKLCKSRLFHCHTIANKDLQICRKQCTYTYKGSLAACLGCMAMGWFAPLCALVCCGIIVGAERHCHDTCTTIYVRDRTTCVYDALDCCEAAGGCGGDSE